MTSTAKALRGRVSSHRASVDYITAFWSEDDAHRFPEAYLMRFINGKIREGHEERRRTEREIQWWGSAGAWCGHRGSERYYRASGDSAAATFAQSAATATQLSRLDLAVTCTAQEAARDLGRATYDEHCQLPNVPNQPRKRGLILGNDGGETFTLGSRTSNVYLRLYDWGVAHNAAPAGCCWRYEAELKGSVATRHAAFLLSSTQRELAITALTRTLFTDRRCDFPLDLGDLRVEMEQRPPSTIERKLLWLGKQVKPALAKLIEAGYIEAAIDAMGLTDHVDYRPPNN